jgi:hypothetical protein
MKANGNAAMTKNREPTKEKMPAAPTPVWAPDGVDLKFVPDEVRRAVADVVQPAYEQLVLDVDDPLEKTIGVTVSHLLWLEILQQADLKREYTKITAVLGLSDDHHAAIDQHLRIIDAKVKLGYLLARLRDQRRLAPDHPPAPLPLPSPAPPTPESPGTDLPITEKTDLGDQNPPAAPRQDPPNTEKPDPGDQKTLARFNRVESHLLQHPALFATQGSVAATYRTYRGRRLGPYFQLVYRQDGRKRSIYLGRSQELADRVRQLLDQLQTPHRQRRLSKRLTAQVRSSLRLWKDRLRNVLVLWGITLKGFEFRGVRRALPIRPGLRLLSQRYDGRTPVRRNSS